MKQLTCREVGVDCDIVFNGETDEEIMEKAKYHAATAHNLPQIPPEIAKKCRAAIKEVKK